MLKLNCRYFRGDRPCTYHKEIRIIFNDCSYYNPVRFKILIIKLDAMGDVLRTTSILPPLKQKYQNSHITWCTKKECLCFLNNKFIDELICYGIESSYRLVCEEFDLVINLDSSKISCSVATNTKATNKQRFLLDKKGFVSPTSDKALKWLRMSAFDYEKLENKLSYQEIIYDLSDLGTDISTPVLDICPGVNNTELFKKFSINPRNLTIGLNTGVGNKWPSKDWPGENWRSLIKLMKDSSFNILLLGGKQEADRNNKLAGEFNYIVNTGYFENPVDFVRIVDICDIVVTCDTFAIHVSTALNKYVIGLFGPTSINETHLYNKGIKLKSESDCKCYYKKYCSEESSCVKNLTLQIVYSSINKIADYYL